MITVGKQKRVKYIKINLIYRQKNIEKYYIHKLSYEQKTKLNKILCRIENPKKVKFIQKGHKHNLSE